MRAAVVDGVHTGGMSDDEPDPEVPGAGFWQAINATPDFPSAATATVRQYERTEDADLDGVIAVDPFASRRCWN
jgi:Protein of unknown function (DUF4012)